ncbi:PREDICTED: neuronal acetylcholine receptor subunit alpha-2-like [Branchiostoma belcheri]|uniref:Neuronal acetylcholine receptor subunit alpha-2-like n=1 Tax=Branchiostoma belcheri TaxID=7741 RepID=A0A6P4XAK5_BRABE|nr:PREDICTED: neuronal acetylcholine receptor subunit alpha-2-like [Branchiostoma belcheri]
MASGVGWRMSNMSVLTFALVVWSLVDVGLSQTGASERLISDIFDVYHKFPRPVKNITDKVTVHFGISLSQLIDMDEKNQVLTTSVWLNQRWDDYKLTWNPDDYDGVKYLKVPPDMIWVPDVLLYNNADGRFDVSSYTWAKVFYNGTVEWIPAGIYKSYCYIDVTNFPFDRQTCKMKFGTWTYDFTLIDMKPLEEQIDLSNFRESGEFVVVDTPLVRSVVEYECCPPYVDITAYIVLDRLPLFFTVNLVIPCLIFTFLAILVFYLPVDAGEKVGLAITILLSLSVFLLVIFTIIPATSFAIPLLAKYLLFTNVVCTISVIITCVVLHLHHRTDEMPRWGKRVFLHILPKLLRMGRPDDGDSDSLRDEDGGRGSDLGGGNVLRSRHRRERGGVPDSLMAELDPAVKGVEYIAEHVKGEIEGGQVADDWKYVAMVVDRISMYLFIILASYIVPCVFGIYDRSCTATHNVPHLLCSRFPQVADDWKYVAMVVDRISMYLFIILCGIGVLATFLPPFVYGPPEPEIPPSQEE